tara:strand:- start:71 stop:250 length:180 start_codon:yes stop_codon:yes gene_type:complete
MTVKELLVRLEKHEEICAVRLEAIDKRLDEGAKRFVRLEHYIWGIYGAIFITFLADKLI